jgi:tRNA(fMet)-specific endonuclease VapC
MNYLLDTCVISEFTSTQPEPKVIEWMDAVNDETLFLSAITIGEIQRGIAKLPDSPRREELEKWLHEDLFLRFSGRILPLTAQVMLTWGKLTAQGRTLPAVDSMIAALAFHHDLCLVTRNVKDFNGTGVTLFNPWPS